MRNAIARWLHPTHRSVPLVPHRSAIAPGAAAPALAPRAPAVRPTPNLPLVVDIKGNALDDGPGIRTVVFLKGCPLACVWCHNPETRSPLPELAFAAADCVGCATCVPACPEAALALDRPGRVDRTRCTLCGVCAAVCPARALRMVGREMTIDAVVETVLRDAPFFEVSGGGVTLSGGEPTLHMAFAGAVLRALKAHGIHTLVETCGLFSLTRFREEMLPWLDAIYFDLKLIDPALHRRYCGVGNEVILENFVRLHALSQRAVFTLLPRTPLIPGITATPDNLDGIAAFLGRLGIRDARLLSYNPTWRDKTTQLGSPAAAAGDLPAAWMPPDDVAACAAIFARHGIAVGDQQDPVVDRRRPLAGRGPTVSRSPMTH